MKTFSSIDEADAWFAPMDWEEFWSEAALFGLTEDLPSEAGARRDVERGHSDESTVLDGLKYMARHVLKTRQDLHYRIEDLAPQGR